MGFDFASIDTSAASTEGRRLYLTKNLGNAERFDLGDGTQAWISFLGPGALRYQAAQTRAARRSFEADKAGGRDDEWTMGNTIQFLAEVSNGWNIRLDGEKPEHSTEAVAAFFRRFPAFVIQAEVFVGDTGNFLAASEMGSSEQPGTNSGSTEPAPTA